MNIKVGKPVCFSEIGQKDNQEDSLYPSSKPLIQHSVPVFLVCDGVGGLEKGEVASSTVCKAFSDYFMNHALPESIEEIESSFKEALSYAYDELDGKDEEQEGPKMGTTLTFAFVSNDNCLTAHIGDSRIYWIRPTEEDSIKFKSSDHSLVNYLVAQGEITPEEALCHPRKNVILKAMQPNLLQRHEAEIHQLKGLQPGDYLFLCSDGVLEKLSEEKLCQLLHFATTDEEKIEEIRTICKGSYDNYTAILVPMLAIAGSSEKETKTNDLASKENITREKSTLEESEESETNKSSWFKKLFHF